jgi:hypothetical protein
MRTGGVVVLVMAFVGSVAFAGDVQIPVGKWKAKLTDFGSWFDGDTPVPAFSPPVVGYEDRSIFQITQILPRAGGIQVWPTAVPPTEELTGLFYDLYIGAFLANPDGSVTIDFVPGGTPIAGVPPAPRIVRPDLVPAGGDVPAGSGGVVDVWLDQTLDWGVFPGTGAPFSGPGAWMPWTGAAHPGDTTGGLPHDDYPGASDLDESGVPEGNALWVYGSFVPLPAAPLLPGVAVITMTVDPVSGTGDGVGYINILGGTNANVFQLSPALTWPPGADMSLQFDLQFPPDIPFNELFGWAVRSDDPVEFETVPEPATLMLFGSCALGALGYWRRRRRVA